MSKRSHATNKAKPLPPTLTVNSVQAAAARAANRVLEATGESENATAASSDSSQKPKRRKIDAKLSIPAKARPAAAAAAAADASSDEYAPAAGAGAEALTSAAKATDNYPVLAAVAPTTAAETGKDDQSYWALTKSTIENDLKKIFEQAQILIDANRKMVLKIDSTFYERNANNNYNLPLLSENSAKRGQLFFEIWNLCFIPFDPKKMEQIMSAIRQAIMKIDEALSLLRNCYHRNAFNELISALEQLKLLCNIPLIKSGSSINQFLQKAVAILKSCIDSNDDSWLDYFHSPVPVDLPPLMMILKKACPEIFNIAENFIKQGIKIAELMNPTILIYKGREISLLHLLRLFAVKKCVASEELTVVIKRQLKVGPYYELISSPFEAQVDSKLYWTELAALEGNCYALNLLANYAVDLDIAILKQINPMRIIQWVDYAAQHRFPHALYILAIAKLGKDRYKNTNPGGMVKRIGDNVTVDLLGSIKLFNAAIIHHILSLGLVGPSFVNLEILILNCNAYLSDFLLKQKTQQENISKDVLLTQNLITLWGEIEKVKNGNVEAQRKVVELAREEEKKIDLSFLQKNNENQIRAAHAAVLAPVVGQQQNYTVASAAAASSSGPASAGASGLFHLNNSSDRKDDLKPASASAAPGM